MIFRIIDRSSAKLSSRKNLSLIKIERQFEGIINCDFMKSRILPCWFNKPGFFYRNSKLLQSIWHFAIDFFKILGLLFNVCYPACSCGVMAYIQRSCVTFSH